MLLRMEAVRLQPGRGQNAMVQSAAAAVTSAAASQRTAAAELARARADFERAKLDWDRAEQLFSGGLISASEHDVRRSSYESARAAVDAAESRLHQAGAELDRSNSLQQEARAGLRRSQDELEKTIYSSPIDGVVTSLPVHVGEQMVPGIQNSPGSYLMTVADMAAVTAEVRVDESDVIEVKTGQPAEVPSMLTRQRLQGAVIEIGTTPSCVRRPIHESDHHRQPGGEGLQGGHRAHESTYRRAAGALRHRPYHDCIARPGAQHSDPSAQHSPPVRSHGRGRPR